ncbi:ornithine cyclodeaminase [Roseovarius sp.]|uniref:ornithine cyclodeaminase family protein n=1 Tax=Roseovarius sp. TaxID=1486281 RepID=UPI00260571DC|nr:ornithine cyclodeaminase [Roseovarius sp.]MDM8168397.1 ornithine cyclodeaminase [Roseovarius sp.]
MAKALEAGHHLPRATAEVSYLTRGEDTAITLSAWIDGLGLAVKSAHVFPGAPAHGAPNINGGVYVYDDKTGALKAVLDFHLVTKWKTAADSLLAALKLARPESRRVLIVGAGVVARSMVEAYGAGFPGCTFRVWNRSVEGAERLAAEYPGVEVVTDLEAAVRWADIVSCATLAKEPLIHGEWLRPGQHVDLIGAFLPDMREADDAAMRRARVFVDIRGDTMENIGEIADPLARGVISEADVLADFYDLPKGMFRRESDEEITLFKNGGGGHLDLMASAHILEMCGAT